MERPVVDRVRFMCTPMMLIDLVAIVPSYLPVFIDLRAIRAFRLIRLLKLTRHSASLTLVQRVLGRKRDELLSTAFLAALLLVVSSTLMFYAEHRAQPEAFESIPASMWWGVAALTTVGYGDVYPITPLGKIIGVIVATTGIGLFAMPAGILGAGFVELFTEQRERSSADEP